MPTTVINIKTLPRENGMYVLPPNSVYIGRWMPCIRMEGPWRNPFKVGLLRDGTHRTRDMAIDAFKRSLGQMSPTGLDKLRHELGGKVLVCWCKPEACHGDWLAELADSK